MTTRSESRLAQVAIIISTGGDVGASVGEGVGLDVGLLVGDPVGDMVGELEGLAEGLALGALEGLEEGLALGALEGLLVGLEVGLVVGGAVQAARHSTSQVSFTKNPERLKSSKSQYSSLFARIESQVRTWVPPMAVG